MGASLIPLMVKEPQFTTPGDVIGQRYKLQQMAAMTAQAQQQQQLNDLKIQESRQNIQDQQAAREAYVEANGDMDKWPTLAAQKGASIKAITGINDINAQAKLRRAQTDEATLTAQTKKWGAIGSTAQGLLALPDDQMMANLPSEIDRAQKAGIITPDDQPPQGQDPAEIRQWLQLHAAHAMTVQQQNEKELADRKEARESASSTEALTEKQRANDAAVLAVAARRGPDALEKALDELPRGRAKVFEGVTDPNEILKLAIPPAEALKVPSAGTPQQWSDLINQTVDAKKYPDLNARVQAGVKDALSRNDLAEAKQIKDRATQQIGEIEKETNPAVRQQKLEFAITQARAMVPIRIEQAAGTEAARTAQTMNTPGGERATGLSGQAYLDILPNPVAEKIKAIAEGRMDAPTGRAAVSGPGAQIMNGVMQYDPDYSTQRAQVRKAFTSGADGKNIGALNTASVHLDQLSEAAKALSNGSFVPGNATWNAVQSMFGGSAPTNFNQVKSAVAGEMASALKGNATDAEIKNMADNINSASSPKQLQDAINTNLHVLGAKLNTYQERYRQQIPTDTVYSPVMPTAKAVFDKHGIAPTAGPASVAPKMVNMKAPNGQIAPVPADQVEHFKQKGAVVVP